MVCKITLNEIVENKNAVISKAIKDCMSYLDNKEYLNSNLNLYISCVEEDNPFEGHLDGMEYSMIAFSVYSKIIEKLPEILLFVEEQIFFEIITLYRMFAKADAVEIVNFSIQQAKDRNIEETILGSRYADVIQLI